MDTTTSTTMQVAFKATCIQFCNNEKFPVFRKFLSPRQSYFDFHPRMIYFAFSGALFLSYWTYQLLMPFFSSGEDYSSNEDNSRENPSNDTSDGEDTWQENKVVTTTEPDLSTAPEVDLRDFLLSYEKVHITEEFLKERKQALYLSALNSCRPRRHPKIRRVPEVGLLPPITEIDESLPEIPRKKGLTREDIIAKAKQVEDPTSFFSLLDVTSQVVSEDSALSKQPKKRFSKVRSFFRKCPCFQKVRGFFQKCPCFRKRKTDER